MSESTLYTTIANGYTQVPKQKWYISSAKIHSSHPHLHTVDYVEITQIKCLVAHWIFSLVKFGPDPNCSMPPDGVSYNLRKGIVPPHIQPRLLLLIVTWQRRMYVVSGIIIQWIELFSPKNSAKKTCLKCKTPDIKTWMTFLIKIIWNGIKNSYKQSNTHDFLVSCWKYLKTKRLHYFAYLWKAKIV